MEVLHKSHSIFRLCVADAIIEIPGGMPIKLHTFGPGGNDQAVDPEWGIWRLEERPGRAKLLYHNGRRWEVQASASEYADAEFGPETGAPKSRSGTVNYRR